MAATQQLLTNLLMYCMYYLRYFNPESERAGGGTFVREEVQELAMLNR